MTTADTRAQAGLRKRTSWTLLGQILYIGTQFVILVLLTRIAGVADLGRFGLASAIVTPVYWLFDFGLRTIKTTDVGNQHLFRDLLMVRVFTTLLGFALIVLISLAYLNESEAVAIAVTFGAAKGVETLSDVCYGVFERRGEMRRFAFSVIARGCGSMLAFGVILILWQSTPLAFIGQLLVWSVVLIGHDLRIARMLAADPPGPIRLSVLAAKFRTAWRLGMVQFIASLQTAVPRFVIDRAIGLEAVGLFTAVAYFLQASNMTMTAVSRSVTGRLADLAEAADTKSFRQIVFRYTVPIAVIGVALIPVAWSIGAWVFELAFGHEFASQTPLIVLMLVTAICRALGILFQATSISHRRFDILIRIRGVDLCLVTILSVAGVVTGGLAGVAAGLAIASAIVLMIQVTVFFRLTRPRESGAA